MKSRKIQLGVLVVLLAVLGSLVLWHQAALDWLKLRGYTPPAAVAQLAREDGLTPQAQHVLYVNHPLLSNGSAFNDHCPESSEKTIVLGCYLSPDRGIYVYAVSDARLEGVEQVTIAHEMLHAAYRRLGTKERTHIDALLEDYYAHGLTDQRIKDTIDAYKQSEPHDVVDEMHSIFGTEVAQLPAPLEQYYKQYFTDRQVVAAFAAQYEAEFTSRQQQVTGFDTTLKTLKQQIQADQTELGKQKDSIAAQSTTLNQERASGQTQAYNDGVPAYNRTVDAYNALLETTKNLINQYNDIVSQRNAVVLEEQQLTTELSSKALQGS